MTWRDQIKRIFTSRYTQSLEDEVIRLRNENRALINSVLSVAGLPPLRLDAEIGRERHRTEIAAKKRAPAADAERGARGTFGTIIPPAGAEAGAAIRQFGRNRSDTLPQLTGQGILLPANRAPPAKLAADQSNSGNRRNAANDEPRQFRIHETHTDSEVPCLTTPPFAFPAKLRPPIQLLFPSKDRHRLRPLRSTIRSRILKLRLTARITSFFRSGCKRRCTASCRISPANPSFRAGRRSAGSRKLINSGAACNICGGASEIRIGIFRSNRR